MTQESIAAAEPKMRRHGSIRMHATHLGVWDGHVDEKAMRGVLRGMLGRLCARGWHVERDPRTLKHYASIADDHWVGRKGDLQMYAQACGRTCEIEFFQEVQRPKDPSPNGGRYDFGKFECMPPRLRLMFAVEMAAVIQKLRSYGYTTSEKFLDRGTATLPQAVMRTAAGRDPAADPLASFNERWESNRFKRDKTGWPTISEYDRDGRNSDRDKIPLRNGETRYFRDCRGHLQRATVFTNMNDRWMVVYGGSVTWVSGWELFHCARPDLEPRRLMPNQPQRLQRELDKAIAARNGKRVATLATLLDRIGWPQTNG